ncbi:hypothetical protein [Streptomyces nymphaeiformis]|uniref:Uncharacterized protein n=1 Tax=Streptomyces nymphaeiformis TaxID=2663842 RepID=A0A7W7U368_9ACTN|nr:hypothetical protein [Streptomyces nymphaeiformis]MBB4984187.1 hypothetical protein [Streptomyces nymphaeiformis]
MPTSAVPSASASPCSRRQTASWEHIKIAGLIALGLLAAFDFLPRFNDPALPPLVSLLFLAAVDGLIALTVAAIIGLRSVPFEGDGFWPLLAPVIAVRAVAVLVSGGLGVPQGPAAICLSACAPLLLVGSVALYFLVTKHITGFAGHGERDFNRDPTQCGDHR